MKKRLITGAILFLVSSIAIIMGKGYFFSLVLSATLLGLFELLKMSAPTRYKRLFPSAAAIVTTVLILSNFKPSFFNSIVIMAAVLTILGVMIKELISKQLIWQKPLYLRWLRAALLFSATCPFLILIRNAPDGIVWTIYCLLIIAASDSFALFGGRLFGKRPLTQISPKKTIEGSLTGLIMSGLVSAAFCMIIPVSALTLFLMGLLVSLLAQTGDLHESLTKRIYQVKDSSTLLPGHGGFYDRLDSYLMVIPVVYYLVYGGFWL